MRLPISAWAIRNPMPVALLFVALTLVGLIAFTQLPIKQFPNINFPAVTVTVSQRGAAPSEVESQITRPVENAIASLPDIQQITSNVSLGSSTSVVELKLGTDLQKATDDIRTAVDRIRVNLPAGIDPPNVQRVEFNDGDEVLTYSVTAAAMSTPELSWFVDDTISRALQAVKGVANVRRNGGVDREINVTLLPDRMAAFNVTAPQVNDALRTFNTDETGGRANVGGREQTVRVLGQGATVEAIRNLTIASGARYVKLSDVAEVGDGSAEVRGLARVNGRPAVIFTVVKTSDTSDVAVEKAVHEAVAKLVTQYKYVKFEEVVSGAKATRLNFNSTIDVLLEGMVLAAIVVWLFLRNWRATAIAAIAMPLSLIPTFAAIAVMGFSLNMITLLALTLVIGILVDDAIVEIENIEKRIERGQTPYRAALIGADSIGLAVVATTSAIVVVFTPVSFMSTIIGQFFKEFGLTVAVAVLFSLLVARLLTPLLAAYFLKPAKDPHPPRPLPRFYAKTLDWALEHKWLAAGVGALVFFASIGLASILPTGLTPTQDDGYFQLNIEGPPGTTLPEMERAIQATTRAIMAKPDAERVIAWVGGADLRSGGATVVLKDKRKLTTDEFKELVRPDLRGVADVRVTTGQSWGSTAMQVVLASEDGPALEKIQNTLMREMKSIPELSDVRSSPPPPSPELVIRPKLDEAARLGVSPQALANVIRVATIGEIDALSAKFSEGKRRLPIRVRLPDDARSNLSVIENLRVPTAMGSSTTLASVADISFQAGPARIVRLGRERQLSVLADRQGLSLGQAMDKVKALPVMKSLPASVHTPDVGEQERYRELITGFGGAIVAGIALLYAVLCLLFGSFFKPITILAALPLSTVGAFLGLLVMGLEISLPVFIGMLMLLGVAAKNSILLVEFAIQEEKAGRTVNQALRNACRERARPIVMTTVAMAAGMMPTALALGEGSEFSQPMAVAVVGGLISSTALSLVLVPVVYEFVDAFETWLAPKLGRFATPKQPGDDAPIRPEEILTSDVETPAPSVVPSPRAAE